MHRAQRERRQPSKSHRQRLHCGGCVSGRKEDVSRKANPKTIEHLLLPRVSLYTVAWYDVHMSPIKFP